ncbi:MFS transporter [Chloroflexota bacterium]
MVNREVQQTPRAQPKLCYGWIVLAACMAMVVISSGIRFSFGVFFKPIEAEFGLSRALTSGIFSVYMVLSALFAILGGWVLDRYKPKILFTAMGLLASLSLLLTSQASELWHIFMGYSLLFAMGTGPIWVLALSIAQRWFVKGRGLAIGIVASGAGIGIALVSPISAWITTNYTWHTSYFILAFIAFFTIIPCALLLKGAPSETIALPGSKKLGASKSEAVDRQHYGEVGDFTLPQAAKTNVFWFVLLLRFLLACCVFIVITHIVPHALDLGINPMQAALILSLIGGANVLGMLIMGRASDRIGRKHALLICILFLAVAMLWVVWSSSLWMLYLFAVIFGFSMGGTAPSLNALIGDTFGMGHIGIIMAVLDVPWGIGAAVGPALAGYIFDISGSYVFAFLAGMLAALIITVLLLLLRVPKAKMEEETTY